jgi:hypothetical protein
MANLSYNYNPSLKTDETLNSFLMEWDRDYKSRTENIELFNLGLTQNWTKDQKIYFAKVFYHARGHFHDFLWFIGNHATSKTVKDIVLKNIAEEMNGSARSHEQLYVDFAKCVGADLVSEFIEEETYLDSIKEFNKGHLYWLNSHDDESRFSAFSAYERLDNIDYKALLSLIMTLNLPPKAQLFFKVHARVQHFETTENELKKIWARNPKKIKEAFQFISRHQIKMWNDLSNSIGSFKSN